MPASNNNRLWITLTLIVLSWLTLLGVGACVVAQPGANLVSGQFATLAQPPGNLPTSVTVKASEFSFSPVTLQVPSGSEGDAYAGQRGHDRP